MKNVMVIGAGQMGAGIAQVIAQAGISVFLHDISLERAEKGAEKIAVQLQKAVDKGKLSATDRDEIVGRIYPVADIVQSVDLVIEAATENVEIKKEIFQRLDVVMGQQTILATNTSSLPITDIASVTKRPEKVIGMHFMNPVPVMKLVEIIRGLATSQATYDAVHELTLTLAKVPVEVKDFPGFVSNRILMPMINEAIFTLYEGVAEKEAVDEVMKLGMNHPMGPLQLADFIGLDTCLAIMETLHDGFGDDKYRPCPLLKQYVMAGWLGKKTGRGFYEYGV